MTWVAIAVAGVGLVGAAVSADAAGERTVESGAGGLLRPTAQ